MKICFLAKWPPVEGRVSRDTFLTAMALVRQGFQVDVVSNAGEVEPEFRTWDYLLFSRPGRRDTLPLEHENLRVHLTDPLGFSYTPSANPFVTKLAALATDIVRSRGSELICGFYLEPFGVAAHLASCWTNVASGIALSTGDLSRLLPSGQLHGAYREVLAGADFLLAGAPWWDTLLRLGVESNRLYDWPRIGTISELCNLDVSPLDVQATLHHLRARIPVNVWDGACHRLAERVIDPGLPMIGLYGKTSETKGSFDLVRALSRLRRERLAFNLLVLGGGQTERVRAFVECLGAEDMAACTWLLPFVPFWQVPHFIRTCTAVCCLERGSPAKSHAPLPPSEVLGCGTCLVLSRDLADKQRHRARLEHGRNVFIVDPRNHEELANTLREVILYPEASRVVGERGYSEIGRLLVHPLDDFGRAMAERFEQMRADVGFRKQMAHIIHLQSCLGQFGGVDSSEASAAAAAVEAAPVQITEPAKEVLRGVSCQLEAERIRLLQRDRQTKLALQLPMSASISPDAFESVYQRYVQANPRGQDNDIGVDGPCFADFLAEAWQSDPGMPFYASDVVRYERLLVQVQASRALMGPAVGVISRTLDQQCCPKLRSGVFIETFHCAVLRVVQELKAGHTPGETQLGEHVYVALLLPDQTLPNFYRISPATRELLQLADGQRSVAEITVCLEKELGRSGLDVLVNDTFDQMRRLGLVEW